VLYLAFLASDDSAKLLQLLGEGDVEGSTAAIDAFLYQFDQNSLLFHESVEGVEGLLLANFQLLLQQLLVSVQLLGLLVESLDWVTR
jgi:hypothetical protein